MCQLPGASGCERASGVVSRVPARALPAGGLDLWFAMVGGQLCEPVWATGCVCCSVVVLQQPCGCPTWITAVGFSLCVQWEPLCWPFED
jgi:hypothetical protein